MNFKRFLDFVFAVIMLGLLFLPAVVSVFWILVSTGRPVFYKQERIGQNGKAFYLWKFRTMYVVACDSGVSGANKFDRITPEGRKLRAMRFDEIPNLFNILRGDMSFVGPRPPLRIYVEQFPDLYHNVLKTRPGLTGLATLVYRKEEERLLSVCATAEETDIVYRRKCIPKKAKIDLIYSKHSTICYDFIIVFKTIGTIFSRKERK